MLGTGFVKLRHDVKIGSRNPNSDKLNTWVANNGTQASAGTFAETASFDEIAVLATLWEGTEHVIHLARPENLAGKIVIDTTNPISSIEPGKPLSLVLGHNDSAGEQVQRWLPKSRVVKAFNIVGNTHMLHPEFPNGPPDMSFAVTMPELRIRYPRFSPHSDGPQLTSAESRAPACLNP